MEGMKIGEPVGVDRVLRKDLVLRHYYLSVPRYDPDEPRPAAAAGLRPDARLGTAPRPPQARHPDARSRAGLAGPAGAHQGLSPSAPSPANSAAARSIAFTMNW
jgi:hypothetical protein